MDKKTKVLFFAVVIISILSVAATYYRYVELNDFEAYQLEEENTDELTDIVITEDQI